MSQSANFNRVFNDKTIGMLQIVAGLLTPVAFVGWAQSIESDSSAWTIFLGLAILINGITVLVIGLRRIIGSTG